MGPEFCPKVAVLAIDLGFRVGLGWLRGCPAGLESGLGAWGRLGVASAFEQGWAGLAWYKISIYPV